MARFNSATATTTKTQNLAGGEAYSQTSDLEFVSILLTSFVQDQFYRTADDTLKRVVELLGKVNPEFAAKAAVYARNEFGMRSITHVVAAELAKYVSGQPWAKKFYESVIYRPDDITEILSYYYNNCAEKSTKNKYGLKTIPASMKSGFGKAIGKFDAYQLAKYRGEGKDISLVDAVNLIHPVPTEKNADALKQLVSGTLKSTDTWESKLTQAGQKAENDEEKAELKKEAWKELIDSKKLGYFAALRNLRNLLEQAPELIDDVCKILTDEQLIKKSLVLPFRFQTALEEIEKISSKEARKVIKAINEAVDISCSNVPKMDGETLVVMDTSGSMQGRPGDIAGLFSAVLVKSNDADFMKFDSHATYQTLNPSDSVITIARSIKFPGGSTDFHDIFNKANKPYDNIFILSDMQGWVGYHSPAAEFAAYKKKYNCNPYVFSFDLAGHGTMQFPENNVFALAGFSEKVFDILSILKQDKKALVNTINNYIDFSK